MRKKHLLMIGMVVLCTVAVIFFCGCRDSSQQASGAAGAVDTVVNVDKADGIRFKICSAYRTYSTQKWLYNNYLNTMGKKLRDIRSAYPGRSEHHTGYAIDLVTKSTGWTLTQDFAKTSEGKWINKHCAEYGFIIRYPKGKTDITGYDYEPWHLRYVGVDAAEEITEQGITLEEYLKR